MTGEILQSGPALTTVDIDDLEARTGRQVPSRYRQFLLEHNGGHPEPSDFVFANPHREGTELDSTVEMFLGIGVGEYSQIERYLRVYKGRIPDELYPIATDPGGNMICMRVNGSATPGEIIFWDHEEEAEEGEPPTTRNLYRVADSLDQLLDRLQ